MSIVNIVWVQESVNVAMRSATDGLVKIIYFLTRTCCDIEGELGFFRGFKLFCYLI